MARTLQVKIVGDAGSLERAFGRAGALTGAFGSTIRRAGVAAAAAGVALAGFGIKSAVDFDRGMRNVNSIARLGERSFQSLEKSVLAIAPRVGQGPKVLAAGLYDIISSGFKAGDAVKVLAVSAKAATAGLTDTATSSRAVTAALNAYHLGADQARRVSDILFQTVNKGVLTFEELAQNMGDLVPAAAPLGISLEEVGAAISTITLQGVPAAEAATRVKNVFLQLAKPSAGLKTLLKEQGFATGEAAIKARGFVGVLQMLDQATQGSVSASSKLTPEIRSLLGVVGLTGKNLKTYTDNLAAMKQATEGAGMTQRAFAEQSKSVALQWDKLKATFTVFAIQIASAVLPGLASALSAVTGWVSDVSTALGNAKGFKAKIAVVWEGAQDAAQKLADAVGGALAQVNWSAVGTAIVGGVVRGLQETRRLGQALITIIDQTMATVDWASVGIKLGPALAGAVAMAFATLLDPGFWIHHWELALSVGLAAFGGAAGKIVGRIARPLASALGGALMGGIAEISPRIAAALEFALRDAGRGLGAAASALGSVISRGLGLALAGLEQVVGKIGGKVIAFTFKVLGIEAAIRAVETMAQRVGSAATTAAGALQDAFGVAFLWMKVAGLKAALAVIEPFSHIPKQGGHWARVMKTQIHNELTDIKFDQIAQKADKDLSKLSPVGRRHAAAGAKAWSQAFEQGTTPALAALATSAGGAAQKASGELGKHAGATKSSGSKLGKAGAEGLESGLAPMPGKAGQKAGAAAAAVSGKAGAGAAAGFSLGSAIGGGVAAGLNSQVGAVQGAAAAIVAAAESAARAKAQIRSPSRLMADRVGKPLGEGIKLGFLEGTADLPEKMNERLQKALERAKQAVDNFKPKFESAWSRLADDAFRAFDARTDKMVSQLGAKVDKALAGIDSKLAARGKAIDSKLAARGKAIDQRREAETPSEKALRERREASERGGRQNELAGAQSELEAAMASGDEQRIIEARKRFLAAENAIYDAWLAEQAEKERKAADAKAERERLAAEQAAERARLAAEKHAEQERVRLEKQRAEREKELRAQRERERRHLEDQLAALSEALEKHPEQWRRIHARIMQLFGKEFGPDFAVAGENLGKAFALGLVESMKAMESAAQQLAALIAKYLKTSSPAEKGPLSTLDTWLVGFAPALLKGLDTASIDRALSEAIGRPVTSPIGAGGLGGSFAGGGGGTVIQKLEVNLSGPVYGADRRRMADELAEEIHGALLRKQQRNVSLGLR